MTLIEILLALTALYCGGMYLFRIAVFYRAQGMDSAQALENDTFHLGLCFILAIGFLGLLLK